MKKIIFHVFIIILLSNVISFAQKVDLLNPQNYFYANKLSLYSIFTTSNENNDSLTLNLLYKIPINNFLYVQTENGDYAAIYNIELSFSDVDGVVRFHKIITDTLLSPVNLSSVYDFSFKNKYLKFSIPNNNYILTARTTDINAKHSDKLDLNYFIRKEKSNTFFSFSIFSKKVNEREFSAEILNNNLSFSPENVKFLIYVPNSSKYNQIKYRIARINKEDNDFWSEKIDLTGKLRSMQNIPEFNESNNKIYLNENNQSGLTTTSADYSSSLDYFEIDFKNNPFVPGNYNLVLILNSKDSLEAKFQVIWDDEPLSFINQRIAIKISEIFFSKSEINDITDGNRLLQFKNLINSWEKYNPNKTQKYNEVLMEYYRRADYSFFNFSTFSEKNGAYSDKARIYILNGPPDDTKETFKNGKLLEKWTYSKLIKEYTFESIEAGVFKLVQIKE